MIKLKTLNKLIKNYTQYLIDTAPILELRESFKEYTLEDLYDFSNLVRGL